MILQQIRERYKFQSTLPMQGETLAFQPLVRSGDDFNPLSLCRERQSLATSISRFWGFQSTLPMQGETFTSQKFNDFPIISIHSPYVGRDKVVYQKYSIRYTFQSTLPMQGETGSLSKVLNQIYISIHSPYVGRDSN